MRRRAVLTTALTSTVLALTACGGPSEGDTPAPDALQVYSSQGEALTKAWAKGFSDTTGIQVRVHHDTGAQLAEQVLEEGAESPADVLLTANSTTMTRVADADLLAPLDEGTLARLPENRRPAGGAWTGVAARSTVLVHNPGLVTEEDLPTSLMDLAAPEYKDRWGAGTDGADFRAVVAGMLAAQGEEPTARWLAGLEEHATTYEDDVATMKAVNAGKISMGVIHQDHWYRDRAGSGENTTNTRLHRFTNEDPGAFVGLAAGGVLTGADHPDKAQQFIAYLLSGAGQQVLDDSGSMQYAVVEGATSDPALPPLESLDAPAVDPGGLDPEKATQLMEDAGIL